METTWLLLLLTTTLLLSLFLALLLLKPTNKLPPGPTNVPILSSLLFLRKSFSELEPIIRNLHCRYGPIISLRIGSRPAVFISSRRLAHHALVQNGAVFADRPPALPTNKVISSDQHNISAAFYGPTWRLLRRNLTSEILHPSRVKSYSHARKWVLHILSNRLTESQSEKSDAGIRVVDHFQYAMFCLLVLMCFGDKLDEATIRQIETVQRRLLLAFGRFNLLNFWPALTKIVLKKKWEEFFRIRKDQEQVLIPLIRARKESKLISNDYHGDNVMSYVDTLWRLELPDEKRKLTEDEMVSLCSEFLNAGTDTTSTALQWIMANVVKYPAVQERLVEEVRSVVEETEEEVKEEVKEEDLQKMPYLKAVILEGLRRHPPAHFVLPHSVSQDVVLDGYLVPKKGTVNFMVADMGWDPEVWEDPMEFKPERFLSGGAGEGVDITGSREIKMMPFGVGRRICPGLGLAVLHLEYFVANLVWKFEWRGVEEEEVDFSEKQEFTMVMRNPLKARIAPRLKK
ncbi:cytochrome P450 89A2-like [Argentina anserina]|uniref:cytochrome P450 89A2-like n=1 Tax=Argentina anserina TaxID=57926 RepID=UPI00217638F2|nr:cytochrome P450 89A2-like [Potentilla anserina]